MFAFPFPVSLTTAVVDGFLPKLSAVLARARLMDYGRTGGAGVTHTVPGPSGPRDLILRTSHGGTCGSVWGGSNLLGELLAPLLQQPDQMVLEMGSGTGFMAMMLASAAAKGTRIIATDVQDQMRDLKYNVSRNQLRHAVRKRLSAHAACDPAQHACMRGVRPRACRSLAYGRPCS